MEEKSCPVKLAWLKIVKLDIEAMPFFSIMAAYNDSHSRIKRKKAEIRLQGPIRP
ncbi:MAG: hypothetical protein J6K53_15725 [Roseburia sp.]|nr:hypothetical protein [Roseburia sp.]